jgi:hypothetical protein
VAGHLAEVDLERNYYIMQSKDLGSVYASGELRQELNFDKIASVWLYIVIGSDDSRDFHKMKRVFIIGQELVRCPVVGDYDMDISLSSSSHITRRKIKSPGSLQVLTLDDVEGPSFSVLETYRPTTSTIETRSNTRGESSQQAYWIYAKSTKLML